ncbi:hypothetical protein [Streptomyces yaizuensis]|uniref:Uncharacterized protein n=1 Tax=Streptomyces yaizuensis TaxID=2989713 RepID=A0AA86J2Y4_9ACTN|nr:hypothetical protein [Streptomyces sp. YSPA8]BDT39467.1 hypothetical protein SYYSPA8_36745 [Streptomyces sp. YSPA8]
MNETHWTAISAVATACAFGVVAWQSALTRRALKVSQAALRISQSALQTSQTVALDTARSRLDAGAPQVTVRLIPPVWPPLAASVTGGMPVDPWPSGHSWHFPQDQHHSIVLQAAVVVENHSGWPVQAAFDGDLIVSTGTDLRITPAPTPVIVPGRDSSGTPGTIRVYLQKTFTILQLSENHDAHENDRQLPHRVTGTVTVHDDRDNGTEDTWNLLLTGHPVTPNPDRGSVWFVVPEDINGRSGLRSLTYDLLPPRERAYWVSRRRRTALDEAPPRQVG